jgi:excisionase family DNA binding protein
MEYEFLTVPEIAKVLKVNKMTIYRYIKAGKITAYKVGKGFRINKKELENFLKRIKVEG